MLTLASCGGGGTNNGLSGVCGGGSSVSGIVLCVDSVTPVYNQVLTPSVDIVQDICTPATLTTPAVLEPYFDHSARVVLSATLASGATQPPVSTSVSITRYVIDYTANPGVTGPTIRSSGDLFETITIPVTGTATRDIELLNTQKKERFLFDLGRAGAFDGIYRAYAVTYTFYGVDQLGNSLVARGFTQIVIGNYDNCAT
jgi:hypothetical protein